MLARVNADDRFALAVKKRSQLARQVAFAADRMLHCLALVSELEAGSADRSVAVQCGSRLEALALALALALAETETNGFLMEIGFAAPDAAGALQTLQRTAEAAAGAPALVSLSEAAVALAF